MDLVARLLEIGVLLATLAGPVLIGLGVIAAVFYEPRPPVRHPAPPMTRQQADWTYYIEEQVHGRRG